MTRNPARRRRGQPVAMLALIMTVWTGARGWLITREIAPIQTSTMRSGSLVASVPTPPRMARMVVSPGSSPALRSMAGPVTGGAVTAGPVTRGAAAHLREPTSTGAAVFALQPLPFGLPPHPQVGAAAPALAHPTPGKVPPQTAGSRWSGDGWLLLRGSGGTPASAPGAASYGASQAGAVVRYRLATGTMHSPYAYLRASTAIGSDEQDREVAAGLAARLPADLPIRLLVEARVRDGSGTRRASVRPAVIAVTELPRRDLPSGFRAEVYAQAGYVAGRNATPFFDAQLVVDHQVSPRLLPVLDPRTGFGVWSGGQRGAARLDLGPRASVRLDALAGKPLLLAVDWRLRAAGSARPDSGPTLTVASSF